MIVKRIGLITAALLSVGAAHAVEPVIDLTAEAVNDSVNVAFTQPTETDGVNLYMCTGDGTGVCISELSYQQTLTKTNGLTVNMLPNATEICFAATAYKYNAAVDGFEFSESTENVCAVTGEPAATEICYPLVSGIGAVNNIVVTADAGIATVDFDKADGANGYNIYVNDLYVTTVKGDTEAQVAHVSGNRYSVAAFNDTLSPAVYGTIYPADEYGNSVGLGVLATIVDGVEMVEMGPPVINEIVIGQ